MSSQFSVDQVTTSVMQFFSTTQSFTSTLNIQQLLSQQKDLHYQTQLIFESLQNQLEPEPTTKVMQRLEVIMKRVDIMTRFRFSEYFHNRKQANIEVNSITNICYDDLKMLRMDFQRLNHKINFINFYNKYKFFKAGVYKHHLDKVSSKNQKVGFQVIQKLQIVHLRLNSPQKFNQMSTESGFYKISNISQMIQSSKQNQNSYFSQRIRNLSEQVFRLKNENQLKNEQNFNLKKQITNLKKQFEQKKKEQEMIQNQRISRIIKIKINQQKHNVLNVNTNASIILMKQFTQTNNKLLKQIQSNRNYLSKINFLNEQIIKLKLQTQDNLKRALPILVQSRFQNTSKSFRKTNNQENNSTNKRYQNLIEQVKILKKLLSQQRHNKNKSKTDQIKSKQRQILKLKDQIFNKNQQIKLNKFTLDSERIRIFDLQTIIKRKDQNQKYNPLKTSKSSQLLVRRQAMNQVKSQTSPKLLKISKKQDINQLLINSNQKLKQNGPRILPFQSEILQGFVYYNLLQKQFKYRYRRACLKNKQLLFKRDGFQIGIHTQQIEQNKVKFIVFLTNQSNKRLQNIKLSLISSNSTNIAKFDSQDKRYSIQVGKQIKINITLNILHYPIGSVTLCVQGFGQQIKLLLPSNILKLAKFKLIQLCKNQVQNTNYERIEFTTDKKIFKSFAHLIQNLTNQKLNFNQSKCGLMAFHKHSNTEVQMFFQFNDLSGFFEIFFNKSLGKYDIADYLVKTIRLLLQKDKK